MNERTSTGWQRSKRGREVEREDRTQAFYLRSIDPRCITRCWGRSAGRNRAWWAPAGVAAGSTARGAGCLPPWVAFLSLPCWRRPNFLLDLFCTSFFSFLCQRGRGLLLLQRCLVLPTPEQVQVPDQRTVAAGDIHTSFHVIQFHSMSTSYSVQRWGPSL